MSGLESKVVENSIFGTINDNITGNIGYSTSTGRTYFEISNSILSQISNTLYSGGYLKHKGVGYALSKVFAYEINDGRTFVFLDSGYENITSIFSVNDEVSITTITTTPTHNTISLDNSNSPAVKFIETIAEDDDGMAHYQVFAQEMVTNAGAYDGDDGEFTQLTNGTLTDDNANTVKTIVASIPLNKYIGDE